MAATNRRSPLDAEPHAEGTIEIQPDGTAGILKPDMAIAAQGAGVKLYRSHFASCKFAGTHRKPRAKAAPAESPGLFANDPTKVD